MTEEEVWRPVVGFTNYELSSLGRLRNITYQKPHLSGKPKHPYWRYSLSSPGHKKNGKILKRPKRIFAHVLVAGAFLGPRPPGHVVNHKDSNTRNPALANLEYVTQSENTRQSFASGNRRPRYGENATNRGLVPLTTEQVKGIRHLAASGAAHGTIASAFGLAGHNGRMRVGKIVRRESWRDI